MTLYLFMKLMPVLAAFRMISGVVGRGLTLWQAGSEPKQIEWYESRP